VIFHSFYAIEIIRGVGHACEGLRMDLVFHITNGGNYLNTNNVDGVIFADIIENRKQVEAALVNETPCLIINNRVDDLDVSYIAVDNELGGCLAAEYLTGFGHKKLATITGNLNTQGGAQRFEGFKKFLEKKHHPLTKDYIFEGDYSRRSARSAMEQFLKLKERPTAIFAASDDMALETIAVAMENGLKVPDDISVIGFDDNPSCLFGPVGLTTIRQPLFQMAEEAVRALHKIIKKEDATKVKKLLKPELIVRESCSSPKK
jgi:DNA-binding LacI/PurR family transcriptional regulator